MGKEISGTERPRNRRPHSSIHNAELMNEFAVQWDPHNVLTSRSHLIENGRVLVTIRTPTSEKVVACTGFPHRGNRYSSLVKILRRKGLIPSRARVSSVLLDKGIVDVRADPQKECFLAGDKVILLLNGAMQTVARPSEDSEKEFFCNISLSPKSKAIRKGKAV